MAGATPGCPAPRTGQMSGTWQEIHLGFPPESEVIFLFRALPEPRICFHLARSTFNSSHGDVRETAGGGRGASLMRARTRAYRRSRSPAGITAGGSQLVLAIRSNDILTPFKQCFVPRLFPLRPPAERDRALKH